MFAFLAYVIAAVIFFLVGHGDKVAQDVVWGFFFVAVGLALSYVPAFVAGYRTTRNRF